MIRVKLPRWIPHPVAWANAVALFVFAAGESVAMAFVMPILIELMRHSPRLAWLGMLAVWLSPIAVAAAIHNVVDGVLGLGESKPTGRGAFGGATSWWAGFVAWAAIIFVTMTTAFVMLVVDPPPVDPDAVWNLAATVTRGVSGIVRSIVWIVLAAYVYELERAARGAPP
jgi:hypothetical protein